jgi:hypothetical protein
MGIVYWFMLVFIVFLFGRLVLYTFEAVLNFGGNDQQDHA